MNRHLSYSHIFWPKAGAGFGRKEDGEEVGGGPGTPSGGKGDGLTHTHPPFVPVHQAGVENIGAWGVAKR